MSVHLSTFVHIFFAILNFVACCIFAAIRIYHQRKWRPEWPKLSAIGLSCMLAELLNCLVILNTQSEWYFGDERWCDLSVKLASATYALHRALLYMFIILRLEVVNRVKFIKPRIVDTAKAVIGGMGIFMVVGSVIFSEGAPGRYYSCVCVVNETVLSMMFVFDVFICMGGTWMFTRPIRKSLRTHESSTLSLMLDKTKFWSIICLISTLISMLTVALVDGAAGVVGFDCSITSFCLLMMMKPVIHKVGSQSTSNIKKKSHVDVVVELKDVGQDNSSSCFESSDPSGILPITTSGNQLGPSEIRLNLEIESVLNQDTLTEVEQVLQI